MPSWEQVKQIFHEAAELPAAERDGFLTQACGNDRELRAEVESLLGSAGAGRTWRPPAPGLVSELWSELAQQEVIGSTIGGYLLVELVAAGGMGAVYRAERADGQINRTVAIKLIRPGLCSPEMKRRFARELQALATLNHPGIARLIDGGVTDEGLPYLILEFVDGKPIDRFCDQASLAIDDRLRLFRRVCEAVEFAHRHLIVHRDLKPRNILITGDGEAKLLDFGIARLMNTEGGVPSEATATLQRVMTPQYASPEQMCGEPVTTTTDVYSLGVILYELLTGHRPYHIKKDNLHDAYRIISDSTPNTPSEAITQVIEIEGPDGVTTTITPEFVSRVRGEIPTRLRRRLRGDLDTIVMTAMHKDPARRYASVERLSEDISRYLSGLPIRARRDTFSYRARKFAKRNKAACIVSLVALIGIALGLVGTAIGLLQARSAQRLAEDRAITAAAESSKSKQLLEFLKQMLGSPNPGKEGRDVRVIDVLDKAASQLANDQIEDPSLAADLHNVFAEVYFSLGEYHQMKLHAEQQLQIAERLHGRSSIEVAEALSNLGGAETSLGNLTAAASLHRESLDLRRKHGKPADMATGLNNLAGILERQDHFDAAEPLHREALAIREKLDPPDELAVARSKMNLAVLLDRRGRLTEAKPFYEEALQAFREIHGDKHPDVATALYNYADSRGQLGEEVEADALYQEALELDEQLLGDQHPDFARSLDGYAVFRMHLGDFEQAEALAKRSLKIREDAQGLDHPDTAAGYNNLATILEKSNRFPEAAEMHQKALAIRRSKFGERSRPVADSIQNLGANAFAQADYRAAERSFKESLSIYEELLPSGHPRIANAYNNLGNAQLALGLHESAEASLAKAVTMRRQEGNPRLLATTLRLWGRALTSVGRYEESEKALRESLSLWKQLLPAGHVGLAENEGDLGNCLQQAGRLQEAEALLLNAHAGMVQKLPAGDQRLVEAARRLTALYEQSGQTDKAAEYRALTTLDQPAKTP